MQWKINQFRENLPSELKYNNNCFMDIFVRRDGVNIYHNYKKLPWRTCDEVKRIRGTIVSIIDGSLTKKEQLYLIEQDIDFEFIFDSGKFSYADMSLGYWKIEGRGCLTGNRLVLCMGMKELEYMLSYLQIKPAVKRE